MTRDQFTDDEERLAHARMLRRIRDAQGLPPRPGLSAAEAMNNLRAAFTAPALDHEPSWHEDIQLCDPNPIRHWCCDWHRDHQETP